MRYTYCIAAIAAIAAALPTPADIEVDQQLFTIELAPGETRQVTEEEKWKLKAVSSQTMGERRI